MAAPKHANLDISIADFNISINHNAISRIEINRVVSDAANKFTLQILDSPAYEVEQKLLQGFNEISVNYYDNDNNAQESFAGNITKMSSTFINNRNMLTLEGYIGLSIQDKYSLKTRNWNKVVLFNWDEIFDDWEYEEEVEEDEEKGFFGKAWDFIADLFSGKMFVQETNSVNWYAITRVSELITTDKIFQDDAGTFYTISQKKEYEGQNKLVKGNELFLPVKPSEILKLMCNGGKLSNLLPSTTSIDSYKDCSFFQTITERKCMQADLCFIYEFLNKHEEVKKGSWTEKEIADTEYVESDLSQVCKSDLKFVYDNLSTCAVKKSIENDTAKFTYNYKFSVDDNKGVTFKPITIEADPTPKKTYVYYGIFENEDNADKSVLTSFSADTDVLTAFLTGDTSSSEKLSQLNLVTNEEMSTDLVKLQNDTTSLESVYKYQYETIDFAPIISSSSQNSGEATWKNYWLKAMSMTYKAEATVTGYCGLKPGDYVQILVLPKKINVETEDGVSNETLFHHTSGTYYIIEQTDTIENGAYNTKLSLIKNVASMGSSVKTSTSTTGGNGAFGGGGRGGGGGGGGR